MITFKSLFKLRLINAFRLRQQSRNSSIHSAFVRNLKSSPVLVSTNKDVYTNLALEHWLYSNLVFNETTNSSGQPNSLEHPIVLIWTDEPSVIIGRHQNPWTETTLGLIKRLGIKLARRHSGGGCVYHDENNINISILGHRSLFENRQANIRFLANILGEKYGVQFEPNKRHDLIHSESGLKISGSAAKLGRNNCYHHFTLLVDTDVEVMKAVIRQKQQEFIKTNSSLSTRSSVVNLKELVPDITVDRVITDLARAYGRSIVDAKSSETSEGKPNPQRFNDQSESINKYRLELDNPDWIYAMSPKFVMEQSIDIVDSSIKKTGTLAVHVNRGKFENIEVIFNSNEVNPTNSFLPLIGTNFNYQEAMVNTVKLIDNLINCRESPNAHIFATLLLKMIREAHF